MLSLHGMILSMIVLKECMRFDELNVMRGPNFWSDEHRQLIFCSFDPEERRSCTEAQLEQLLHRLEQLLPGWGAGKKKRGSGTAGLQLAEIIAHTARALQDRAGMKCDHSAAFPLKNDRSGITLSYQVEQAGECALDAALRICEKLLSGAGYDEIRYDVDDLQQIKRRYSIGPTTGYILSEIKRREIPFRKFNDGSLLTLGYGCRQKKIRTAITGSTSGLGMELAGDKEETKMLLAESHLPVPKGILVDSEEELIDRISEVKFPLVIKPLDGNHGRGVTTDINSLEGAIFGYHIAKKISRTVIVEEFIKGEDHRFLVVDHKLVAVTKRIPAHITGDGHSTIGQLIDQANRDPQRGDGDEFVLALIKVDDITKKILADKQLSLDDVLPTGRKLVLKDTANISMGGIAEDVTDTVHPDNVFLAERISKIFGLDICGIDIMTTSVSKPITRETGAIIEVNAGPGLRMHSNPQKGKERDVAGAILNMLFPERGSERIPVIAVDPDNNITSLLACLLSAGGFRTGYCNSEGIFIHEHHLFKRKANDIVSIQDVLFDPTIEMAVLECSSEEIMRNGLGFDSCDTVIISGISPEVHLVKNIGSVEDATRLKKILVNAVQPGGHVILNADDEHVRALADVTDRKVSFR